MLNNRLQYFKLFFRIIIFIFILKLFYIQILDEKYKKWSTDNSVRVNVIYPSRGEILDRNGVLLAQSKEAYDLYVTPRDLKIFDTTLLCSSLNISKHKFDSLLNKCKRYSYRKGSIIIDELSQVAKLKIDELNIPGFKTEYRPVRSYPYSIAGNVLGYVGNVSRRDIEQDEYYNIHDYIGKTGIERVFENDLRGDKGESLKIVNVYGAVVDSYEDGADDYASTNGSNITTTIDLELQQLGEELMKDKIGAIVAIEPATGEILAMISSPNYNPDLLIGDKRTENYRDLARDKRMPLYNRSTSGAYPPGSIFKLAISLVALQQGVIDLNTLVECNSGFYTRRMTLGCHKHISPSNLEYALQTSCNSFFCSAFIKMVSSPKFSSVADGVDSWSNSIKEFGFGSKLGSDITNEAAGNIPNSATYNRYYGTSRWDGYTMISVSIGQGEVVSTPLQLANFGALIANRGFFYTPHIVKKIEGSDISENFTTKNTTSINKEHYETVIKAMWKGVNETGSSIIARVNGLDICGKTGTVENGFGNDHSTFLGIAPMDSPKIVINVYVENGGFGSALAAPIASLMIEKYLTGTTTREWLKNKILEKKVEYPQYANEKEL